MPPRLLVVGGGYIGLEMGLVYAGLGSQVTVVEFFPRLLPGADLDLVDVVVRSCEKRFHRIMTESKVVDIQKGGGGYIVTVEYQGQKQAHECDQILVAVGRRPNTDTLGLEHTAIRPDKRGFIEVNPCGRTVEEHIYAIGDVTPGPMLAHKASHEGKVAAEVIADHHSSVRDNPAIPAVVFTDPELAWTGLTEREAAEQGLTVNVARFPFVGVGTGANPGSHRGHGEDHQRSGFRASPRGGNGRSARVGTDRRGNARRSIGRHRGRHHGDHPPPSDRLRSHHGSRRSCRGHARSHQSAQESGRRPTPACARSPPQARGGVRGVPSRKLVREFWGCSASIDGGRLPIRAGQTRVDALNDRSRVFGLLPFEGPRQETQVGKGRGSHLHAFGHVRAV